MGVGVVIAAVHSEALLEDDEHRQLDEDRRAPSWSAGTNVAVVAMMVSVVMPDRVTGRQCPLPH